MNESDPSQSAKTLVIFFDGTFVGRENGAHVRILDLVGYAADHFRDVVLYSYSNHPTCPWTAEAESKFRMLFPGVKLVVERRTLAMRLVTRIKNAALTIFPQLAAQVLQWSLPRAAPAFDALMSTPGGAVLLLNYVDGATLLNGLRRAPFIIETHDVKFLKHSKRYQRATNSLRVLGKLRSEVAVWQAAAALVAISPMDAAVMRSFVSTRNFYVPSYGSANGAAAARQDGPYKYDLLFVGSANDLNALGLREFLTLNRDWLQNRTLAVAGRVSENAIVAEIVRGCDFCSILGFQPDLDEVYAQSKLVVSPVEGTGLKMKVAEALAHGKPVCGSDHSIEALPPGWERCVFPLTRSAIEALIEDPIRLQEASAAARAYYRSFEASGELSSFSQRLTDLLGA
jgi:glycosyltransferase involved in cell wall biosynthesis